MPAGPPTAPAAASSTDLVLSSGFLAFARHTGVIAAIEAEHLEIDAVCGTSSGAVVGALFAAGYDAAAIAAELSARRPYALMRPSRRPWRGVATLDALIAHLRTLLPAQFSGLDRPLAVGVVDRNGDHRLLSAGALPEAVAASCAMPGVFCAVDVGTGHYRDGGAADRLRMRQRGTHRVSFEIVDPSALPSRRRPPVRKERHV